MRKNKEKKQERRGNRKRQIKNKMKMEEGKRDPKKTAEHRSDPLFRSKVLVVVFNIRLRRH